MCGEGGGRDKQQDSRYLLAGQCMRCCADRLREGVSIDHKGGYLAQWVDSLVLLRQLHVHTHSHTTKNFHGETQSMLHLHSAPVVHRLSPGSPPCTRSQSLSRQELPSDASRNKGSKYSAYFTISLTAWHTCFSNSLIHDQLMAINWRESLPILTLHEQELLK